MIQSKKVWRIEYEIVETKESLENLKNSRILKNLRPFKGILKKL